MPLFKHQEEGVTFLTTKKKAILADQMGLGKTRQAVVSATQVGGNTLVLCPASLKTNWAREILMVDPDASVTIYNGQKEEPYSQGHGGNWVVANYDIISRKANKDKIKSGNFDTVILDEAHYIKNSKSARTKTALDIVMGIENRYLLTGTPIMNRPEELFTLLKAIGHPLGASWYSYVMKYCGAFWRRTRKQRFNPRTGQMEEVKFLDTSGATNLQELQKQIQPTYLRRTKEILGDTLPAKVITNVPVEISKEDRKKYEATWDEYMHYLENNPIIFSDMTDEEREEKMENIKQAKHLVELQKLKQVASRAKVSMVVGDVVNTVEQGEKVILFTQYTETLQQLRSELKKEGVMAVTLSGEDDQTARQLSIDAFQKNDTVKVFIGNIKAAGVGITLTEASTVVFVDMEWTPALHEQAEDRAHRIGQKSQVNVYYYIAKQTIEEDIVELLGRKNQIIKTILEGKQKRAKQFSVANELIKKLSTQHGYTQ